MSLREFIRFWLPPLLWTAVIFTASGASFSGSNTQHWLATLINAFGHPLPPAGLRTLNFVLRKIGHLTGYGILGTLWYRAFRGARAERWNARWALAAIAIAAVVASLDEWHQSFVPGRSSSPYDVLLDTIGAALAQVLFLRT